MSNKNTYTVEISVTDNNTGKNGKIVLADSNPDNFEKLGSSIQALCYMVNLEPDEIAEIARMTYDNFEQFKEKIEAKKK